MRQFLMACLFALAMGAGFSASAAENEKDWYLVTDMGMSCRLDSVCYMVAADDDEFFSVVIIDGVFSFVQQVAFVEQETAGLRQPIDETREVKPMLVHGVLHLSACRAGKEAVVLNLEGKTLLRQALGTETTDIDVRALPKGVYLLQIGNSSFRFMKQ